MPRPDVDPLREILHRALVRYLTVRPGGLLLAPGQKLRRAVDARILGHGAARTLYRNRKPHCRSLDGVAPISGDGRQCVDCRVRSNCTPQVRLDLVVEGQALRLLLAHTSARNFLVYDARLRQRRLRPEDIVHRIDVVDRGSWGELRFSSRG